MMNTKKRLWQRAKGYLFGLSLFFIVSNIFGQEIQPSSEDRIYFCPELSAELFSDLVQNGRIDRMEYKGDNITPKLYINSPLGEYVREVWQGSDDPVFIAESLFFLPKDEGWANNDISLISKIIRSVSTMEGIEYYSNSNQKIETLYKKSYTINNPDDKKKIPDKTDVDATNLTTYVYQEDNSFGKTVYQADIRQTENEVAMVLHNVEPIKFGFINAVKKNNLSISFHFLDKGDFIVTYIYAQIKFPALSIFENKVSESFRARIDAIYNWFLDFYLKENKD
ncbi:MAG: hypothetical protein J6B32_04225 [Spirochaetaceae bacterium]|nr:hypothetical protein [Spirochaetaceae bacterium]MBO5236299.1 hypothetical protein [Spirochaetaceae bacterium]